MKRTNFREVNKKLNELKTSTVKHNFNFLTSEFGSAQEKAFAILVHQAYSELEQFRNTKISEGI